MWIEFSEKSLRSTRGLKYSKELMVQNLFQSPWLCKHKRMIQAETNN